MPEHRAKPSGTQRRESTREGCKNVAFAFPSPLWHGPHMAFNRRRMRESCPRRQPLAHAGRPHPARSNTNRNVELPGHGITKSRNKTSSIPARSRLGVVRHPPTPPIKSCHQPALRSLPLLTVIRRVGLPRNHKDLATPDRRHRRLRDNPVGHHHPYLQPLPAARRHLQSSRKTTALVPLDHQPPPVVRSGAGRFARFTRRSRARGTHCPQPGLNHRVFRRHIH